MGTKPMPSITFPRHLLPLLTALMIMLLAALRAEAGVMAETGKVKGTLPSELQGFDAENSPEFLT
jgi:hypothetical protein